MHKGLGVDLEGKKHESDFVSLSTIRCCQRLGSMLGKLSQLIPSSIPDVEFPRGV